MVHYYSKLILKKKSGRVMMQQLSLKKRQMRHAYASMRDAISKDEANALSNLASLHVIELIKQYNWKSVMVYIPFRSELNIWPIIHWCWEHEIEVIVPKCEVKTISMHLYSLYNKDQLVSGAYQILEPNPEVATLTKATPDAVIVPGLAFTVDGGRLGYGGGYYDRFYESMLIQSPSTKWIGIGYDIQVATTIPMDKYDMILNILVTNKGISKC